MWNYFNKVGKSLKDICPCCRKKKTNKVKSKLYYDLTPTSDCDKDLIYNNAIESAFENKNIRNVALSGSYGSGKSSILKSFISRHPEYKILNISLASFNANEMNDTGEKKVAKENIYEISNTYIDNNGYNKASHQLLELSILQQIIYQFKINEIPDSRIKRIRHLSQCSIIIWAFFWSLWLFSIGVFCQCKFIVQSMFWTQHSLYNSSIISYLTIILLFLGVLRFIFKLIRLFNNSKLTKLNVKSCEIEVNNSKDSSLLNRHLDEILYIFESNKIDAVVIEDLDRFNNHDIFSKLREINLLINQSPKKKNRVIFIYAVRDDIFKDKQRTKFFDFIIPVIPVVNNSNSKEFFYKQLKEYNKIKKLDIDKGFIDDVCLYLDDMRLLKNIWNEYLIYSKKLDQLLKQTKLFAMVIYKNIYPSDFVNLHKNRGEVFSVFHQKSSNITNELQKIDAEIEKNKMKIVELENIIFTSVEELRAVYINKFRNLYLGSESLYINSKRVTFSEILEDDNFQKLVKCEKIYYLQSNYERQRTNLSFSDLENKVNSIMTYEEREKQLKDKLNGKISDLNGAIIKLESEKDSIKIGTVKSLINGNNDSGFILPGNKLVVYLLRNGYIDENYYDYISYFYEGSITKEDKHFLLSVKNREALDFDYQLEKVDEVLKKMQLNDFKSLSILNVYLLNSLLKPGIKYSEEKRMFFELLYTEFLSKRSEKAMKFIDIYIQKGDFTALFIPELCNSFSDKSFWSITMFSDIPYEKKELYFGLLLKYLSLDELLKENSSDHLMSFISTRIDFLNLYSSLINKSNFDTKKELQSKITQLLLETKVHFHYLEVNNEMVDSNIDYLLEFIYKNNLYAINEYMIELMLRRYGADKQLDLLQTSHYTTIQNSNCKELKAFIDSHINMYIKNVFLSISSNKNESEENLVFLLNNEDISIEERKKIIEKSNNKILLLSSINDPILIEHLFIISKIIPSWKNVFDYFIMLKTTLNESIISFLNNEENYSELFKEKINLFIFRDQHKSLRSKFINRMIESLEIDFYIFKSYLLYFTDNTRYINNCLTKKLTLLIENKKIVYSSKLYSYLKNRYPNLHLVLLSYYWDEIQIDRLDFDNDDILKILNFSNFNNKQKRYFLSMISVKDLKGNDQLSQKVLNCLMTLPRVVVQYQVLLYYIKTAQSTKKKVVIFSKVIYSLSEDQITEVLGIIDPIYASITVKKRKPLIENREYNLDLVRKLKKLNYISFYKIENDHKIRIYTKSV